MTYKIAVLSSSGGTVLQAIMDELKSGRMPGITFVGLFTDKKNSLALKRAKSAGYKTFFFDPQGKTRVEYDREMLEKLKELKVDLVVLAGYMRILSGLFVENYRDRIINVHPSLLPDFAGGMDMSVHGEVLKSGVEKSGMTIHLVDESLDRGLILMQSECKVVSDETPTSLKEKVQALECKGMVDVIKRFADGSIQESIEQKRLCL